MKPLRLAVSSVLFAGSLAACSQPNDVPALQEEATQLAKSYQVRFDELEHRLREIKPEGFAAPVARAYQQGAATIGESKNLLRQIPLQIQAGVKNRQPDELQKLIDQMHHRFEDAITEANVAVTAVEDQVALAHRGLTPGAGKAEASNGSTEPADVQPR